MAGVPVASAVGMSLAIVGGASVAGARMRERIKPATLRLTFGWFVLAVAVFVVAKNWSAVTSIISKEQ
jgi:uncharacterized membrane protein YfcA